MVTRLLVLLLAASAGGCATVVSIQPLEYPLGARVRSVPLAVAVEVVELSLDPRIADDVGKLDAPETIERRARLAPALGELLARDLAERGPFGVAQHAPAVLRVRARHHDVKHFHRRPTCRLELEAELRDRSGGVVAKAAGASEGECWLDWNGVRPVLDLGLLAGRAGDELRRALAEQAPAVLAKLPALPQTAPATLTVAPAPAPGVRTAAAAAWLASPAPRERRLAVLEFAGPLDAGLLGAMSDEVRAAALEAVRAHGVSVMTRESAQLVLAEMGKSVVCVEGECEVETARNIGADLVVSGTVLRVDGVHVLTMKLHETARGTLLATASARGKTGLETLDAIRPAAATLFR